ncbi:MAG: hypothetical protein IJM42_05270 [Synergistes sp.]|nr:hypothetical protein [Synergistes sp.]
MTGSKETMDGKIHLTLFLQALKRAQEKAGVRIDGTEKPFCCDLIASEIERLTDKLHVLNQRVNLYRERYERMSMFLAAADNLRSKMLDWEEKDDRTDKNNQRS